MNTDLTNLVLVHALQEGQADAFQAENLQGAAHQKDTFQEDTLQAYVLRAVPHHQNEGSRVHLVDVISCQPQACFFSPSNSISFLRAGH